MTPIIAVDCLFFLFDGFSFTNSMPEVWISLSSLNSHAFQHLALICNTFVILHCTRMWITNILISFL